jgi:plastocyanin
VRAAAAAAAVVLASGVVAAGCGGGGGGAAYHQPAGPAQMTIRIQAGNFYFKPGSVKAPAGIDRVELVGRGGDHTLVIDGVKDFKLSVGDGDRDSAKVQFRPGRYTFFCDIPGHRSAGMEGTITVT